MIDKNANLQLGLSVTEFGEFAQAMQPFLELMTYYECAMMEVKTKIEVLNKDLERHEERNPVESIKTRLKRPVSILEKLDRKGLPRAVEAVEDNIHDVAGVRIICSFIEDIYKVADMLVSQDDIRLIQVEDYIKKPKPNGYRSLHLLVGVPIFLSAGKKEMCVEVQIRTVAMDFWASIDHKIRSKKDFPNKEEATDRLRECAKIITALDEEMQEINRHIEGN